MALKPGQPREYHVFLASPGDMEVERRAVRRYFIDYNRTFGRRQGIRLEVIDWENCASIDLGRPQELINDQTLRRFGDSLVLFIGLMGQRFGTPSGEADSGTEEEFNLVLRWRSENDYPTIKWFFRRIDPFQGPSDPEKLDEAVGQWKRVRAFKQGLQTGSSQSLYKEFDTPRFAGDFKQDLDTWLTLPERPWDSGKEQPGTPASATLATDQSLSDEIGGYLARLEQDHGNLRLAGFESKIRVPIALEDLYVPLHARIDLRADGRSEFADAHDASEKLGDFGREAEIPLTDAFKQAGDRGQRRGVVIVGDPGSGKTTHLRRLLLWAIKSDPTTIGLPAGIVPIFLALRDLPREAPKLDRFVADELEKEHMRAKPGFGARLLERGNLLFLLDGLDEVPDEETRARVSSWIERARKDYPDCYFAVTCRYAGYTESVRLGADFLELHLRPLDAEQADAFIRKWYEIVETSLAANRERGEIEARERANELIEHLKKPDFRARRVSELTRNPMLLTAICLIHRDRGRLPRRRVELYREAVNVMVERWREAKKLDVSIGVDAALPILQPLAFWLHGKEGRVRASEQEIATAIAAPLEASPIEGDDPRSFLRTIRDESGILTGWSDDSYGFMHLAFQEYLTARAIRAGSFQNTELLAELASYFGESWWSEVILLVLAESDPSLFEPFMRELVKTPGFALNAGLLEQCFEDAAQTSPAPFVELLREVGQESESLQDRRRIAFELLERFWPVAAEQAASEVPGLRVRVVEEARDGHFYVEEKSGYELVLIRGGTFSMGSPEDEEGRYDDEGPVKSVALDSFYLGRYPVTNEEYGRFLSDMRDVAEPEFWSDRQYNQARQPVVGVSWDEAKAYCDWAGLLLPTEAQWEYACRAGTQTRFWSGDTEADLSEVGWYGGNAERRLHIVGEKPANPFGLHDLHGNVWEWCRDWFGEYSVRPGKGDGLRARRGAPSRVFRGGGWKDSARSVRSAFRSGDVPARRSGGLGFRPARHHP